MLKSCTVPCWPVVVLPSADGGRAAVPPLALQPRIDTGIMSHRLAAADAVQVPSSWAPYLSAAWPS